ATAVPAGAPASPESGAWAQADRLATHSAENRRLECRDIGWARGRVRRVGPDCRTRRRRGRPRGVPGGRPFKSGRTCRCPRVVQAAGSACACTPATARPDGSAIAAKLVSQAIAAGEEQAMDLPPGTVWAQAGPG